MINNQCHFFKFLVFFYLLIITNYSFAWEDEREHAMNLKPILENGKQVYKVCIICHHETGWSGESDISRQRKVGFYPQIAGQHKNVIIKQLADIRAGNRDNPTMYPFTLDRHIGDVQEIADVSAYVASLPANPNNNNNIGSGYDLELGKKLYHKNCKKCHGENGEGSNEDFYPRIQGQHYNYLLRQFIWIRDGKRRNANKKMIQQIKRFTYRDITAVNDYVSRLQPVNKTNPSEKLSKKK